MKAWLVTCDSCLYRERFLTKKLNKLLLSMSPTRSYIERI
jgi:hypothetical protein